MDGTEMAFRLGVEGLYLVLLLSAPPVGAASLAALATAVLARAGRLQDPALWTLPRLLAGLAGLLVASPWIARQTVTFGRLVLLTIPSLGADGGFR